MKFSTRVWQDWLNVLLGIWVIIQPWAVGYQNNVTATWTSVIAGILIVVFALWANAQRSVSS